MKRRSIMAILAAVAVGCGSNGTPVEPSKPVTATHTASAAAPVAEPMSTDLPSTRFGNVPVYGRVLDYATRAAIVSATVTFNSRTSVRTRTDGWYDTATPPGLNEVLLESPSGGTILVYGGTRQTDLFVRPGTCSVTYGTIFDARSHDPVAGASVRLVGGAVTGSDGSYVIQHGCPFCPGDPFNCIGTTFMTVTHPNYVTNSFIGGRVEFFRVPQLRRLDVSLVPRE